VHFYIKNSSACLKNALAFYSAGVVAVNLKVVVGLSPVYSRRCKFYSAGVEFYSAGVEFYSADRRIGPSLRRPTSRVTSLGEISPIGRLLLYTISLKITEVPQNLGLLFPTAALMY
jgi:hypothetical protein